MARQTTVWSLLVCLTCIHATSAAQELLQNADFESTNYNGNWGCQGGCHLSSSGNKYQGSHSVKVTNRHHNWEGVYQNLNLLGGHHYRISAYVQLVDTPLHNAAYQKVEAMMSCTDQHGKSIYFSFGGNPRVAQGHWYEVGGVEKIPAGSHNCHMYIQTASPTGYLVDSASVKEVPADSSWRSKANTRIEQHRKADVSVSFAGSNIGSASFDIELKQTGHEFIVGSAVNARQIVDSSHQAYQKAFFDNFEWGVLENALKWPSMERTRGHVNYDTVLTAINSLRAHGKKVRGHCVFWSNEQYIQDWVKPLYNADLMSAIDTRIQDVVGHTKGTLEHWDVNNENIHFDFYERHTGNPDITQQMFRKIHTLDRHPKLYINEYNVLNGAGDVAMALKDQASRFLKAGVPIGGIGIQGHLHTFDLTMIQGRLDMLAEAGLPLMITEFGVNDANENTKATKLTDLMTMFFAHPSVQGVMFWGFWDGQIWEHDAALFTGPNVTPNAAGRALIDLVKNQWTSHSTFTLHGHQTQHQRLFKGTYELTVKTNGHTVKTEHFTLTDSGQNIQIHLGSSGGSPSVSHIVVG